MTINALLRSPMRVLYTDNAILTSLYLKVERENSTICILIYTTSTANALGPCHDPVLNVWFARASRHHQHQSRRQNNKHNDRSRSNGNNIYKYTTTPSCNTREIESSHREHRHLHRRQALKPKKRGLRQPPGCLKPRQASSVPHHSPLLHDHDRWECV